MKCPKCKREIEDHSKYCEYCGHKIDKAKWPLFVVFGIVAIGAVVGIVISNGNKNKEEMAREEQLFRNCVTAADYREYLSKYPDGEFASLANNKINDMVNDSIAEANDAEAMENMAYEDCSNAYYCRKYLSQYPRGRYASIIRDRLEEFVMDSLNNIQPGMIAEDLSFTVRGVSFTMKYVQGGDFIIGVEGDSTSSPTHWVSLSDYYIGEYEVTQKLWRAVMGDEPKLNGKQAWTSEWGRGDMYPAYRVSWYDCQDFISNLNGLLSDQLNGARFRMPTNAEWEYAARGGAYSNDYKFSGTNNMSDIWYADNAGKKTHPVNSTVSNELGIYDMTGNVWELCNDVYAPYVSYSETNPMGGDYGPYRVVRGGSWTSSRFETLYVKHRGYMKPDVVGRDLSFRLALR